MSQKEPSVNKVSASVTRYQQYLVFLLYGVIAIALLSPLASAIVLPNILDVLINVGHTFQARQALEEGQFPLREGQFPLSVPPSPLLVLRYPIFQFYGQFIYTLTGLVYKYFTPDNPYAACLLVLWLSLTVAGFFIYQTGFLLTRSKPAAILAGVSYMAAPYLLVNIHARGALAEVVAQGILPVVLYYTIRCYMKPRLRYGLGAGMAWFALATTHAITFVYSSLFIGLLILLVSLKKRTSWKRIIGIGLSYSLGWLLSLYFLAPIVLETNLHIRDLLNNPYDNHWLTPLSSLLQPISLPSEPQPGQLTTPNLHIAVGWVMLIAFAIVLYYYFARQFWSAELQRTRHFVAPLLAIFVLAFFMVWSPFDFWQFLPRALWVTQYSYRIMTHLMWAGALLLPYALILLFRVRLDQRHLLLGVLLIVIASSSYLPTVKSSSMKLANLIIAPANDLDQQDYLYKIPKENNPLSQYISPKEQVVTMEKTMKAFHQQGIETTGKIMVSLGAQVIQIPVFYYPDLLEVKSDGTTVSYFPFPLHSTEYVLVGLRLTPGVHQISVKFTGLPWANWISAIAWLSVFAFAALSMVKSIIKKYGFVN